MLAGDVDTEVGLLIARVDNAKMQTKALGYIKGKYWDIEDGGKKSYRQILDLLNERFTLDLAKAIFDVNDEMLLPSAGYCGRCPKRSGNAPEFVDIVERKNRTQWARTNSGTDVCTDPDCFDAKKRAHLKREVDKLTAKGKTVVDGNKARQAIGVVKGGCIALKDVRDALKAATAKPATVLIQNPRDGKTVEAVKLEDVKAAGVKVKEEPKRSNSYEKDRMQRELKHAKLEAKAKAENTVRRAILDQVRARIRATERTAFDLHLIAPLALGSVGWNDRALLAELHGVNGIGDIEKRMGQLDIASLTHLILDCVLVSDAMARPHNLREKPTLLLDVAKHYGVDADAIRKEVLAPVPGLAIEPTPSKAARATKDAAAGKPAKRRLAPIKLGDPDAPAEPELADDQTDDAGSAGVSDAQAAAPEQAAS